MKQAVIEDLLGPVRRHLQGLGIQPQEQRNAPATESELSAAETTIGAVLPPEIRSVYREYANGFRFRWALDDDFDDGDERDCLELPDLTGLVAYRKPYRDNWASDLDLSDIPDPRAARDTVTSMQHWLPFWEEANGDQFCLDLRDGKIVFNVHDWFDGGDGTNGHLVAHGFVDFITAWSKVCFSGPMGLYWPDAFSDAGIDWLAEHFDQRYMVP
jgi:cell wall assembly regulator SMI1